MIELIYRKPLTIHGVPRSDVVAAVSAATLSMPAQSSTSAAAFVELSTDRSNLSEDPFSSA
jgi:hypothetical protein